MTGGKHKALVALVVSAVLLAVLLESAMQKLKRVPLLYLVVGAVERVASDIGTTPKRLVWSVAGVTVLILVLVIV